MTRFSGMGRVAKSSSGIQHEPSWVGGHLLLVGDFIGFAWVPLERQVFFARPDLDTILRMLGNNRVNCGGIEDVKRMRFHFERCYDETITLDEDEDTAVSLGSNNVYMGA